MFVAFNASICSENACDKAIASAGGKTPQPKKLTKALALELFAQVLDEFLLLFFSESLSKFFLLSDDCLKLFHRFLERF